MNTHRVLSRNSASSRAIPLNKQIDKVYSQPAVPVVWAAEQKGMQGGDEVPKADADVADDTWRMASVEARAAAQKLGSKGIHKSIANRLLEPFMWHTAVVTGTAFENFFAQRCSPMAQPEIRAVAEAMEVVYDKSTPQSLEIDEWHLPYVNDDDAGTDQDLLVQISAARCARVSYLTQDGKRDPEADLTLYRRLVESKPAHWSPLEHVATPWAANRQNRTLWVPDSQGGMTKVPTEHLPVVGNLLGWRSLRTTVEALLRETTYR